MNSGAIAKHAVGQARQSTRSQVSVALLIAPQSAGFRYLIAGTALADELKLQFIGASPFFPYLAGPGNPDSYQCLRGSLSSNVRCCHDSCWLTATVLKARVGSV